LSGAVRREYERRVNSHALDETEEEAWQTVFASWLPGSGYQPDDRPCYELYHGDPTVEGKTGAFRCDLCLPVCAL